MFGKVDWTGFGCLCGFALLGWEGLCLWGLLVQFDTNLQLEVFAGDS